MADPFDVLRDSCSAAARNLGLATDPQQLSPEHWQQVLTSVETRARMHGINLSEGWRESLAEQMGRNDADAFAATES
ncbi:hypothetical protein ACQKQD_31915 [Methylobacterium sp. NPDC080182]|uniref:hypothetical protein n=1 Tax=Methylobacterium sp. NPDC080182 TaxID=3390590 RepID=UPI003D04CD65